MTSVRKCEQTGNGLVGASFREFPSVALPAVLKIRDQLRLLGLDGILAVVGGRIGLWGQLPPLVRNEDAATGAKITRDLHAR